MLVRSAALTEGARAAPCQSGCHADCCCGLPGMARAGLEVRRSEQADGSSCERKAVGSSCSQRSRAKAEAARGVSGLI